MRGFVTMFLIVAVLSMGLLVANPLMGEETKAVDNQKVADPMIVLIVGLLLPGGGWLMLGDMQHFIMDFLITLLLSFIFIGFIYSFYSAWKAYQEALKRQEAAGVKE